MQYAQIGQKNTMYDLTAIYWIKNETPYLPEWIEFHLMQGFDHFIFYDNHSTDNFLEVMEPYVEAGLVEIRYYPDPLLPPAKSGPPGSKNFWIMDYCIDEQMGKSRWIHFHAVDEFTFMRDGSNIVEFLKKFENVGALAIEWELFNSSGHIEKPKGLTIENFTHAFPDSNHAVKTIIKPEFAICTVGNPHNFLLNNGMSPVMEDFSAQSSALNERGPTFNIIKNHHYLTRSKQEFNEKNNKGLLDHAHTENIQRSEHLSQWDLAENHPNIYVCTDLLKYVDPVREAIRKRFEGREHLLESINY